MTPPKTRSPSDGGNRAQAGRNIQVGPSNNDPQRGLQGLNPAEKLWERFCKLRLHSTAYRAIDDPVVAAAYKDWLASYLENNAGPKKNNVVLFRAAGCQ